jgi:hypothetical protein
MAIPNQWLLALRWGGIVLAAAALLGGYFATSRVVARRRDGASRAVEDRETLATWRDVWPAALRWLRGLFARCRAGTGHLAERLVAAPRPATPADQAIADARAAYRQLLALGHAHGLPRAPSQTPDEYHAAWRNALAGEPAVAALTEAYDRARYGPAPAAGPPADALRAALHHLGEQLERAAAERLAAR